MTYRYVPDRSLVDVDIGLNRQACYDDMIRRYHEEGRVIALTKPSGFTPALCHPDREHEAHGMCKTCYHRWWRHGQMISLDTARFAREKLRRTEVHR